MTEVVDRGASRIEACLQRILNRLGQQLVLRRLKSAGLSHRVNFGTKESLIGVDVSNPGDGPLVEQKGLDRGPLAGRQRAKRRPVQSARKRFNPETASEVLVERIAAEDHFGSSKTARIGEAESVAPVQLEYGPLIRNLRVGVVEEVAGHPEVTDKEDLIAEIEDQVLPPPIQPVKGSSLN